MGVPAGVGDRSIWPSAIPGEKKRGPSTSKETLCHKTYQQPFPPAQLMQYLQELEFIQTSTSQQHVVSISWGQTRVMGSGQNCLCISNHYKIFTYFWETFDFVLCIKHCLTSRLKFVQSTYWFSVEMFQKPDHYQVTHKATNFCSDPPSINHILYVIEQFISPTFVRYGDGSKRQAVPTCIA